MSEVMIASLAAISAFKWAVLTKMYKNIPAEAQFAGKVSGLFIYPIKSCGAIEVSEAECKSPAMQHPGSVLLDRHFVILKEGRFVSLRQYPTMALIKPEMNGNVMILNAPGMPAIQVDIEKLSPKSKVISNVQGEIIPGLDCGQEVNAWLSKYLGFSAQLIYSSSSIDKRKLRKAELPVWHWQSEHKDEIAYPDVSPYLLIGEKSLDDLNTKLESPIQMARFRANITVSDTDAPFIEDTWKYIYIGNVKFSHYQKCGRCVLPCVDPNTGVKNKNWEPLKTLRSYRTVKGQGAAPFFGVHLLVDIPGHIKKGDDIYVVY